MAETDASVVIVTRDRPLFAAEAIRSVLTGEVQPREVIVVDQSAAPDPVLDRVQEEHATVTLVRSSERGLSRGRNLGASMASGEFLAFLDDDELADAGWLGAFVAELWRAEKLVVTGRVLPGTPEAPGALVSAAIVAPEPAIHRGRIYTDPLAGGNMAIRRTTLAELGGFDTQLGAGSPWPGAEDNDLGLRLLDAGYAIRTSRRRSSCTVRGGRHGRILVSAGRTGSARVGSTRSTPEGIASTAGVGQVATSANGCWERRGPQCAAPSSPSVS